jgi:hypothetical protein
VLVLELVASVTEHPAPATSTQLKETALPTQRAVPRAKHFKLPQWVKYPVIAVSLIPAAWIFFALWSDLTRNTRFLGANPVKEMEHFMGEWNIRFLVLTLAVSPLIKLTGWGWLIRYRRIFGLLAFFYIFCHLSIYFVLDVELDGALLVEDVSKRLYITLGMAGFLLLGPARDHIHQGLDKAARQQALERTALAHLSRRGPGPDPLLHGGEAGYQGAAVLRAHFCGVVLVQAQETAGIGNRESGIEARGSKRVSRRGHLSSALRQLPSDV